MSKTKKHFLSIFSLALFFVFAVASSSLEGMHGKVFNYNRYNADRENKGNYLVKNDGTKIYGNIIEWNKPIIGKGKILLDKKRFEISEIKGYQEDGIYFGRNDNYYIRRIVTGKVNLYVSFIDAYQNKETITYSKAVHYYQKETDLDNMKHLYNMNDLKKLMNDCPKAFELVNMRVTQLNKKIDDDKDYLNKVFELYNNCNQ